MKLVCLSLAALLTNASSTQGGSESVANGAEATFDPEKLLSFVSGSALTDEDTSYEFLPRELIQKHIAHRLDLECMSNLRTVSKGFKSWHDERMIHAHNCYAELWNTQLMNPDDLAIPELMVKLHLALEELKTGDISDCEIDMIAEEMLNVESQDFRFAENPQKFTLLKEALIKTKTEFGLSGSRDLAFYDPELVLRPNDPHTIFCEDPISYVLEFLARPDSDIMQLPGIAQLLQSSGRFDVNGDLIKLMKTLKPEKLRRTNMNYILTSLLIAAKKSDDSILEICCHNLERIESVRSFYKDNDRHDRKILIEHFTDAISSLIYFKVPVHMVEAMFKEMTGIIEKDDWMMIVALILKNPEYKSLYRYINPEVTIEHVKSYFQPKIITMIREVLFCPTSTEECNEEMKHEIFDELFSMIAAGLVFDLDLNQSIKDCIFDEKQTLVVSGRFLFLLMVSDIDLDIKKRLIIYSECQQLKSLFARLSNSSSGIKFWFHNILNRLNVETLNLIRSHLHPAYLSDSSMKSLINFDKVSDEFTVKVLNNPHDFPETFQTLLHHWVHTGANIKFNSSVYTFMTKQRDFMAKWILSRTMSLDELNDYLSTASWDSWLRGIVEDVVAEY